MNRLLTTVSVLGLTAGGGGSYTQNRVTTTGAYYDGNSGTPYPSTEFFEVSVWLNPTNFSALRGLFSWGIDTYFHITTSGTVRFRVERLANVIVLDRTSTTALTAGVWQHLYFSYNLRTGTYVAKLDGVDMTLAAGTGPLSDATDQIQVNKIFNVMSQFGGSGQYVGGVADLWIGSPTALFGYGAFHDSGNPANLASLLAADQPLIYMGGTMEAADWNSATNLGDQTITLGAGTFTDAPPYVPPTPGVGSEPQNLYSVNRLALTRIPTNQLELYSVNRLTLVRLP